jgi:TetR/AcrR family transcriptional regulator, transcriptional repressor for nem operon
MTRTKEFDRDVALSGAIEVFSEHGFEGTSCEALVHAMGIGRQSLYNTFGDKRKLYVAALERYTSDSISEQFQDLRSKRSAMKGIEAHLRGAVERATSTQSPKCLGISAICEFGRSDSEISAISDAAGHRLLSLLERCLSEAKAAGEIAQDVAISDAANFIVATLVGIKIAARAGASPEALKGIARMALRSLQKA